MRPPEIQRIAIDPELRTTILHSFRALLRATTYLPDDAARTYIHQHIVSRFRNPMVATPTRLLTARRSIGTLQRAGDGELRPLQKVLLLTYGRIGKRRAELLGRLLRSETALSNEDSEAIRKAIVEGDGLHDILRPSRPALDALLKSQSRNHPPETEKVKIRHLEPQIPKENSWGRPVPQRVQKNIKKKFWGDVLAKALPPVPEHEWNRLRDLTLGVIPFQGPPLRRSRPPEPEKSYLKVEYLKAPIEEVGRRDIVNRRVMDRNKHKVTPRLMRRLWGKVWNQTPKMWRDKRDGWCVEWGGGRSSAANGLFREARGPTLELFDGIDEISDESTARPSPPKRHRRKTF